MFTREKRELFINSFRTWYVDGMTVDDTQKIFVNTSGKSRVCLFTTMMTVLSKTGKIISSTFKYTKNYEETRSILLGIKNIWDKKMLGN